MTNDPGPSRQHPKAEPSANGAGPAGSATASGSATPAARARPSPGPSPFHESSQYKHWRYSPAAIASLRAELNEKSKEVTVRNMAAEKAAQQALGHDFSDAPPPAAYLSVDEELLLVRFYCSQCSNICRAGFGLPETVEATAISYIKRFYLKNSVMEWHPKNIMPTCLFLAAKTTNHPVPVDAFVAKLKGFEASDVLDLEFLIAQSLSFEFWVRGADKPLRGWYLEFQDQAVPPMDSLQRSLPAALEHLSASRYSDAEFLFAPAQIALACWRLANRELVDNFLEFKYQAAEAEEGAGLPYGTELGELRRLLGEVEEVVRGANAKFELKKIKEVDKRLKSCTNPEKVPGTALYMKRKAEQEAVNAEAKAEKAAKAAQARKGDDDLFGAPLNKSAEGDAPVKKGLDDPFA